MKCQYCGKSAGLFKKVHQECQSAFSEAIRNIVNKISQTIISSGDFSVLEREINDDARTGYLTQDQFESFRKYGFDRAINSFLEDGVISKEEENKITAYLEHFNIKISDAGGFETHGKILKGAILNEIFQGETPKCRLDIEGNLPFFLEKNEEIIWIFQGVEFYEQRNKTRYEGRSQGVSIRIAKGVYYRVGQFEGNPVVTTEKTLAATGMLTLTNTNLYFSSPIKNFKTPYKKIIYMTQYSDGIELQKDGATAKPQTFKELDGWFTYNIISNLREMQL
ncbi:MAG TPA: hypothetical protein VFF23_03185 [Hanamia sp.]|nr:hypothetical protein [Hanamia sp.]